MILSKDRFDSLIDSPAKVGVLRELMKGGVLTERRLSEYAGISHVYASRLLEEFERFNLAQSKRVGKANLWEINRRSYAYQALQPFLESLRTATLPLEALKGVIREAASPELFSHAVLYGSVVMGGERDESDIDLCLVLKPGVSKRGAVIESVLENLTVQCYELFGKKISCYLVSEKEWNRGKKSDFLAAIQKGEKVF